MRWFVRGDIDGFFGLALDNLVQLLLINALCRYVLQFPDDLLYARILPGAAVSLLIGNLYYAWQAKQLAEREGRSDVCALPYGLNTPSIFAYVFLVMVPAKISAGDADNAAYIAWQAGLLACVGSGIIEFIGSFFAEHIRKATPRAALLATLAGIALTFISLPFVFRTYARPEIGLACLAVILVTYFGGVRFKGGLPGGLIAVLLGTLLAWIMGVAPDAAHEPSGVSMHLPIPIFSDIAALFDGKTWIAFISVIIPMGIFNVIGSLQNIESAEAAGDSYDTRSSLAVNGAGTLIGALFGSCFPTTIYIGHPGWKALGARSGYSILNGIFVTIICLTGTLAHIAWAIPIDAGMAIVVWISIIITAQAFQATPKEHAPAVVVGLFPGIAAWGAIVIKNSIRATNELIEDPDSKVAFTDAIIEPFLKSDTWVHGAFALEQGFIFTAMILAAATVSVIDRKFVHAAVWCAIAALLSVCGLMHSYELNNFDAVLALKPAWPWAIGYTAMAAVFLSARWICEPNDVKHD